jgi:hypothetical protein
LKTKVIFYIIKIIEQKVLMKGTKETYRLFASKMREDLYRRLRLLSAAEGKPIQALLEEAVTRYLADRRFSEEQGRIGEPAGRYSVSFDMVDDQKKSPKRRRPKSQ